MILMSKTANRLGAYVIVHSAVLKAVCAYARNHAIC